MYRPFSFPTYGLCALLNIALALLTAVRVQLVHFPNFLKVTALITGNKNVTHEHRGLHNKVKHPHRNRGLQKCNPKGGGA